MLPTYSKQYDADDSTIDTASDPLLSRFEGRTSTETAPPIYPPSSSSALPPSTEGRRNVVYKYKPIFPREGDEQYAVGVLGRSRAVSYIPSSKPFLLNFAPMTPSVPSTGFSTLMIANTDISGNDRYSAERDPWIGRNRFFTDLLPGGGSGPAKLTVGNHHGRGLGQFRREPTLYAQCCGER